MTGTMHADYALYETNLHGPADRPLTLFVPQSYEPRYAYPLVVALHGRGERETQWLNVLPMLSLRNYVVVALRGPTAVKTADGRRGFGWNGCDPDAARNLSDYVDAAVRFVREHVSVNRQRICLAGVDEGATAALRLAAAKPTRFERVAAYDSEAVDVYFRSANAVDRLAGARRPRVLLGCSVTALAQAAECERRCQLLRREGVAADFRLYSPRDGLEREMLRDLDHWLLDWPRP